MMACYCSALHSDSKILCGVMWYDMIHTLMCIQKLTSSRLRNSMMRLVNRRETEEIFFRGRQQKWLDFKNASDRKIANEQPKQQRYIKAPFRCLPRHVIYRLEQSATGPYPALQLGCCLAEEHRHEVQHRPVPGGLEITLPPQLAVWHIKNLDSRFVFVRDQDKTV